MAVAEGVASEIRQEWTLTSTVQLPSLVCRESSGKCQAAEVERRAGKAISGK